jgi:ryanodine receptor 2
MIYQPKPIDTTAIELPVELNELVEKLSESTHDNWAIGRLHEGWRPGPERDDEQKTHPCLVPYSQLPESEKEYDRVTATETLKAIIALGYTIKRD